MTDSEKLEALMKAIEPFIKTIQVNDGNTLSRLIGDDTVVWHATGSWQSAPPLTIGHFRTLGETLQNIKKEKE